MCISIGRYVDMVPPPKQSKWYNIYIYIYPYIVYTHYMASLGILYIHTIQIYISLIIYYISILCKYIHIVHTSYHSTWHLWVYIYNIPGDFSFRIAWKNPCNLGKPRHNLSPENPPFPRVTFLPAELPPRFGSRISPQ